LKRGKTKDAWIILKYILDKNPNSIMHNLLQGVIYNDCLHNELLAKRQFEVARLCILRQNKKIANAGEMPLVKPFGQDEIELSDEENDKYWLECIVFMIKNNFVEMAETLLSHLRNKESIEVKRLMATAEIQKGNFKECVGF